MKVQIAFWKSLQELITDDFSTHACIYLSNVIHIQMHVHTHMPYTNKNKMNLKHQDNFILSYVQEYFPITGNQGGK